MFRRLFADTAIYGGADFISRFLLFLTFPLIAANISVDDFGALELVLTITSILGMLASCGLNNAVQRFYWDGSTTTTDRQTIVSTGIWIQSLFLSIGAVFGTLIAAFLILKDGFNLGLSNISLLGLLSAIALMFANQISVYILDVTRLHFKPWRFLLFAVLSRSGAAILAIFAVAILGLGVNEFLSAQALAVTLAIPLGLWFISKDLIFRIDLKTTKLLLQYGYPFIFASAAFWLLAGIDRWMLASMRSIDEVGIYSIATRFASIGLFFSTAFGMAWSPWSVKLKADQPKFYRQRYAEILVFLLCGMMVITGGISIFSSELLAMFMPSDYWGASSSLSILVLSIGIQSAYHIAAVGISLERKTYLFARIAWAAVVLNFLLNFFLIPNFGTIGAAISTVLANILIIYGYFFYSQRLHPIPVPWGILGNISVVWGVVFILSLVGGNSALDVTVVVYKTFFMVALSLYVFVLASLYKRKSDLASVRDFE